MASPSCLNLDGQKLIWHQDRLRKWLDGERVAPITIDCSLTRACNYRCVYCLRATTKILMADFTWKEIQHIQVGEEVIGFDETNRGNDLRARFFKTKVTEVFKRYARLHIVSDKQDNRLFITKEHKMLCEGHRWREPARFKTAKVRFFFAPYKTDLPESFDYKLGYLKGLLEGDGTFGEYKYKGVRQYVFKLDMIDEEPLIRASQYIRDLFCFDVSRRNKQIITSNSKENVTHLRKSILWKRASMTSIFLMPQYSRGYLAGIFDAEGSLSNILRISNKTDLDTVGRNIACALDSWDFHYTQEKSGFRLLGGVSEIARFLGQTKPAIKRKVAKLYNKRIPNSLEITHTSQGGTSEIVFNLETESKTYVANGFCVHNCYGQLQENAGKPLSEPSIRQFLDDAAEIGVKGVSFVSDGESTLSPHFKMAVTHGKANGLDMAVGTNGYALADLEEILPCLTYLRFNISAATPKRYSEIMGVPMAFWDRVIGVIKQAVEVKQRLKLSVTIGLQMVLLPSFADQVMPLARLGKELGVDYTIIKHCSDDEFHALGVDYSKYKDLDALLHQAESLSTETYQVAVKWSKIMSGGKRRYTKCYGPAFIMQFSGSGLVAPCGMLFNERYKKDFHIGNIGDTSFKKIWRSDRYWEVLERLHSPEFNPQTMCGSLCLQHKVNEFLWDCVNYSSRGFRIVPSSPAGAPPPHLSFI